MSRILVLYGTTEGHTAKVAAVLAETLRGQGAEVDIVRPALATRTPITMPCHRRRVSARRQVSMSCPAVDAKQLRAPAGRRSAFASVSLAVLRWQPKLQREVNAIVERFLMTTGWRVLWTKSIAGALVYTKYGWLKRWVMRRIAEKAGGDTDTSRDDDYTDWQELRAFAERLGQVTAPQGQRRSKGYPVADPSRVASAA